jgi:hypothetical protein
MEVSGHLHAPAALLPSKEKLLPTEQEGGSSQVPVWDLWSKERYFALTGNIHLAVQHIYSRHADLDKSTSVSAQRAFSFV